MLTIAVSDSSGSQASFDELPFVPPVNMVLSYVWTPRLVVWLFDFDGVLHPHFLIPQTSVSF